MQRADHHFEAMVFEEDLEPVLQEAKNPNAEDFRGGAGSSASSLRTPAG